MEVLKRMGYFHRQRIELFQLKKDVKQNTSKIYVFE